MGPWGSVCALELATVTFASERFVIEDALRGRTTARPPLVDSHCLCNRPLLADISSVFCYLARAWQELGRDLVFSNYLKQLEGVLKVLGHLGTF